MSPLPGAEKVEILKKFIEWRELSRRLERKVKVLKLEVQRGRGGQESDHESQAFKQNSQWLLQNKVKEVAVCQVEKEKGIWEREQTRQGMEM